MKPIVRSAIIAFCFPALLSSQLHPSSETKVPVSVPPAVERLVSSFKPEEVVLLDSKFKRAMETDKQFLMKLDPDRRAIFYGPLVLAGDFGEEAPGPTQNIPVFVTASPDPAQWVRKDSALRFTSGTTTYPGPVNLRPFHEMVNEQYTVYWDFFSPDQWKIQQQKYQEQQLAQQDIETRTMSLFRPGEMQPERDHLLQGELLLTGESNGRKWRAAQPGGYLSFEMQVHPQKENVLTMTYWGQDNRNSMFHILVDDTILATEDINRYKENRFYEIEYRIPLELTRAKQKITIVMKEARPANSIGPFYLARITRAN
jgi:hypothetical protein